MMSLLSTTRLLFFTYVAMTPFVMAGTARAQSDGNLLPSQTQTPTPIVRALTPPPVQTSATTLSQQGVPPTLKLTAPRLPFVSNPSVQPATTPPSRPMKWRLVPLNAANLPTAGSGATVPATNFLSTTRLSQGVPQGSQNYFVMPSTSYGGNQLTSNTTLQPVPLKYLPQPTARMAANPAQLPYNFPKPGQTQSPGGQLPTPATPAQPTTRTTTWGEISSGANGDTVLGTSQGMNYDSKSMVEPTPLSPIDASRQQPTAGSNGTTHGCAEDDDQQTTAGDGAGQKNQQADCPPGPNINPPWINRIFPKAEPFWMNSPLWRRFDSRRQKVSAKMHNVVNRATSKRICNEGCNCWDCLRARRIQNRDFGGWLSYGTTFNSHGNGTSTGNDPLGFNNFADGLLLNQAWLYAERRADTTTRNFDFGYRVDFLFGADAPDTTAFGDQSWDFSWGTAGEYGFALPQAYATIAYKDLFVNIGRFYTIIGYESVMAPANFFYSHALTFQYNEPFTHTGALAQYNWNQYLTLFAGATTGWDAGYRNQNDGGTFLGGIRFDVTDRLNLFYATSIGDPGDTNLGESDVYMHSLVANAQITQNINYILQWDYQDRETFGTEKTNSYAINQYLLTRINDRWAAGTRFEYFRDDDGARIGNGPGDYFDLTLGLNYRRSENFVIRPEIRYDWFEGNGLPYDDNTERDQFTVGIGGYWTF
jgi:hypothetical protein